LTARHPTGSRRSTNSGNSPRHGEPNRASNDERPATSGTRRRTTRWAVCRPARAAAALEREAAAARRAQAEADKLREAQRQAAIFQEITSLHRHDFPPVERPVAPMPEVPDRAAVNKSHEKNALRGVGMFDRARRAAARQYAAQAELDDRWRQAQAEQGQAQQELDRQWARLAGNDPDTVLATLVEAFEDNEAPAAPVGIDGTELSLILLVPGEDAVPERLPATTQAGNLTLRKLPKGERSALYLLLIAGHVLVTLREAFAVAPGVDAARVIAVRRGGPDIYGRPVLDCMVAGRWTRTAFNGAGRTPTRATSWLALPPNSSSTRSAARSSRSTSPPSQGSATSCPPWTPQTRPPRTRPTLRPIYPGRAAGESSPPPSGVAQWTPTACRYTASTA
jgi:hypothetical protein